MNIDDDNLQRGVNAQLEALNLIEAIHHDDRAQFDHLLGIAVSTPTDLVRAAVVIADMTLTLPNPNEFDHRLGQLRKAFSKAAGAQ